MEEREFRGEKGRFDKKIGLQNKKREGEQTSGKKRKREVSKNSIFSMGVNEEKGRVGKKSGKIEHKNKEERGKRKKDIKNPVEELVEMEIQRKERDLNPQAPVEVQQFSKLA